MKTPEEILAARTANFVAYVHGFYGPDGIYPIGATIPQIAKAATILLDEYDNVEFVKGGLDSYDRERVRDILIQTFGLKTNDRL